MPMLLAVGVYGGIGQRVSGGAVAAAAVAVNIRVLAGRRPGSTMAAVIITVVAFLVVFAVVPTLV